MAGPVPDRGGRRRGCLARDGRAQSGRRPLGCPQAAGGRRPLHETGHPRRHRQGGIYDPSIEYTPDGKTGWLAYSSITGDFKPVGPYVHTHLARSDDHGKSWHFVKSHLPVGGWLAPATRQRSAPRRLAIRSAVAVLRSHRSWTQWKLLVHKYFWNAKKDRMIDYGWIAAAHGQRSGRPVVGRSALVRRRPVVLFGVLEAGRFPRDPYHQTKVDLNQLDPSLADAVAYSEPGTIVRDGTIYLSLTLAEARRPGPYRAVGLAGPRRHVAIRQHLGQRQGRPGARLQFSRRLQPRRRPGQGVLAGGARLAPSADARRHGGLGVRVARRWSAETQPGRFAALWPPISRRSRRSSSGPGAGQSDYDEHNTEGGLLMPQFNVRAYPEVFQIYQTGRRIVP